MKLSSPSPTPAVPEPRCPYCGKEEDGESAVATCGVCGMRLGGDWYPHIILLPEEGSPTHFCSVACMYNFEHLQEAE